MITDAYQLAHHELSFFWLRVNVCVWLFIWIFLVFLRLFLFSAIWFRLVLVPLLLLSCQLISANIQWGRCCCVEIKYREREMERRNKRVNKAETLQMLSFEFSFCLVNILWNVLLFMVDTFAHHFEYHDHQNRWTFSQNTNRITAISESIY